MTNSAPLLPAPNFKLYFSLLIGLLASCQAHDQPPAAAGPGQAATLPSTPVAARQPALSWTATRQLPPSGPGDTLTAAARALLRTHDLAPFWGNTDKPDGYDYHLEGFYGPDYHRIEFYFDVVRRDSLHPEQFRVRGRNRYRKVITPFAGTITVQAIFRAVLDRTNRPVDDDTVKSYAVRASYELREDPATKGAGVYQGEAMLDIYQSANGSLHQTDLGNMGYYPVPNQDGGLTFRGTWTDNKTSIRRPAAWADNLQRVTPIAILEEEALCGRCGDVNPALVKRGWNELWGNDEWWATTPNPSL